MAPALLAAGGGGRIFSLGFGLLARFVTLFGPLAGAPQFFDSDAHGLIHLLEQSFQPRLVYRVFKQKRAVEMDDRDLFAVFG